MRRQMKQISPMMSAMIGGIVLVFLSGAAVSQAAEPASSSPSQEKAGAKGDPGQVQERSILQNRQMVPSGALRRLPPTVTYATTSIKCGNTTYEVSTGTKDGSCSASGPTPDSPNNYATCSDSGGKASANCSNGCGPTTGAGSCTIK